MNINKLQLLYHSVRHTRPQQLIARMALLFKRHFLVLVASPGMIKRTAKADQSSLTLNPTPPSPLLPARTHLVTTTDNGIELCFLNHTRPLRDSNHHINWRPDELKTGTRLWLLNLHYTEFLEALPAEEAGRVILDWINQVMPYQPDYWLDNWNSYSLSIRVVVWMQQLSTRDLKLSTHELDCIKSSLIAQMRFLNKNLELDICGNHLIKNIKALIWAAQFFNGSEADRWGSRGRSLLKRELKEQILADGMHFELSPTYHNQVFADLIDCYCAMIPGADRETLGLVLDNMAQLTADFQHPDGDVSLFNDSGFHLTYRPADCITAYTRLRGKSVKHRHHIKLNSSGYYGLRNDQDLFLIDCAELAPNYLPAHGHGDALSFEWSINGQRVFVDAGVYEYNPGQNRSYSRATSSHNTVNLDGKDQSEFWKAFRVGRRAHITRCDYQANDTGFILVGSHDGYTRLAGRPVHSRSIAVSSDTVTINDSITGGNGQVAQAVLLLHPNTKITQIEESKLRITTDSTEIEVSANNTIEHQSASWHPDQGVVLPTKKLTINYGNAPCQGEIRFVIKTRKNDSSKAVI